MKCLTNAVSSRLILLAVTCLGASATLPPHVAAAQSKETWADSTFTQLCPTPRTDPEVNKCVDRVLKKADSLLRRTYLRQLAADKAEYSRALAAAKKAGGLNPPQTAQSLEAAQRAWVRFRDALCVYVVSGYEGGTMHSEKFGMCLADEAITREQQIRRNAKGER